MSQSPDQIDALVGQWAAVRPDLHTVLISHFHGDHIGGLRDKDNALVYPNAEIMVPAPEWAFWMDDGNMSRAQAGDLVGGCFAEARRNSR